MSTTCQALCRFFSGVMRCGRQTREAVEEDLGHFVSDFICHVRVCWLVGLATDKFLKTEVQSSKNNSSSNRKK